RRRRCVGRRCPPRHAVDVQLLDVAPRSQPHARFAPARGSRPPAHRRAGASLRRAGARPHRRGVARRSRPVRRGAGRARTCAPPPEPDLTRPLPRSVRALAFHDFRVFWSGAIGSSIGNNMQLAALLWVVAVSTRSAAKVTLIAFITVVPLLLLGPLGGLLADRFPRRRLLLVTHTLLMVQAFALWGLWDAGYGSYWVLFTV